MKVRKLAVALALAGTLGTGMAHAVGLGQIKLESYLNQPLKAKIKLLDAGNLSPDQVIVGLASKQDFSQAGIKRTYNLSNLKFKVVRDSSGNMVVDVTTDKPVHEPFMDFLVDLNWPNGRVMREYTLLVDPPTYEKSQPAQAVTTAGSSTPRQPAPASAESQTGATQTAGAAGSPSSGAAKTGGGTYGPTQSNDTLWRIAERVKPSARVTTQQEMLAIRDRNPDAFIDGNINRMKRGQVLRLPTLNQVESRSRHQAVREVIAQNRAFNAMRQASQHPAVNATSAKGSGPGTAEVAQSGDQLKLVVANNGKETKNGSHGGGTGGTTETSLRNKLSVTQEQVDKLKRDNSDLNARLQDLQDQVKTLKRLVQLKNDQLSSLQVEAVKQANTEGAVTSGPQATQTAAPSSAPAAATSAPQVETAGGISATSGSVAASTTSAPVAPMSQATSKPLSTATASSQPMAATSGKAAPGLQNSAPANQNAPAKSPEQTGSRSTVDKLVQLVLSNRIYQIAAGGVGILILIALWLLARRNAHHEKRFYENLRDADEGEPIELGESGGPEEDGGAAGAEGLEAGEASSGDPLSEADVYIAYGRFDQATHLLEEAISAEPSRTDLRLKLLETYAESGNRDAFGKQFRELEAMGDDASVSAAEALQGRLQEAEDVPSISDLESELKAGVQRGLDQPQAESGESGEEYAEQPPASGEAENDDLGVEWDLDEFATDFDENLTESATEAEAQTHSSDDTDGALDFGLGDGEADEEAGSGEAEDLDLSDLSDELERSLSADGEESETENDSIEFSLDMDEAETDEAASDLEMPAELESPAEDEPAETAGDLESIEFEPTDLARSETEDEATADDSAGATEEPAADLEEAQTEDEQESPIDESFLDELDAELDKVTGESEAETADDGSQAEAAEPADTDLAGDALPGLAEDGTEAELPEPSEGEPAEESDQEAAESEDALRDLELDVSDEDLAIMEEASQAGDEDTDIPEVSDVKDLEAPEEEASEETETVSSEADADLLDIDLDENEDALLEEGETLPEGEWDDLDLSDSVLGEDEPGASETDLATPEAEPSVEPDTDTGEDWESLDLDTDFAEEDLPSGDEPVAEENTGEETGVTEALGTEPEDEDFDFLAGTDEAATKLDLARAYIEMGDSEGAKDILEEVSIEGNEEQKKEAQDLLKSIS